MATFKFKKPISKIEQPELLPKDWYSFRISTKPEVQENSKKTGENLFQRLRVVMPDDEMFDGRELPLWLAMPTDADEENYDSKGKKIADAKMERIVQFVEASGGTAEEDEFDLSQGAMVGCYVIQALDQAGHDMENKIDIFAGFKSIEDLEPDEDAEGSDEDYKDVADGDSLL